jgi:phosphoribosylglycinamide formyltransferase 1
MNRKRVGILISGRGSNMTALIEAAKADDYPAEIVLVISNVPNAGGIQIARETGIPTEIVNHITYNKDRTSFEQTMQKVLEQHRIDLICLAGFMRLLTSWFVEQWRGRILNIHPALLPAFKGIDTHRRALEAGVKLHGATVHFVVPEMDSGPIIAQGALAVRDEDNEQTLAARVLTIEHTIYPLALKFVAEGRVHIEGNRCIIRDREPPHYFFIAPQ